MYSKYWISFPFPCIWEKRMMCANTAAFKWAVLQLLLKWKGFKSLLLCINCAEDTIAQFCWKCTSILKDSYSGSSCSCLFLPSQCFLYVIFSVFKWPASFASYQQFRLSLWSDFDQVEFCQSFCSLNVAITCAEITSYSVLFEVYLQQV